jgi:SAM-dependent methyltransferase
LEVGIGTDCRLIRRGFYDSAFQQLFNDATTAVELTGVDVQLPTDDVVLAARRRLDRLGSTAGSSTDTKIPRVNLQLQRASITDSLSFPDGYFDAVVCCLTLCSVTDQEAALREIKRLVRPDGGTFGYVEHVAVNKEEPYRFLEAQQTVLDPLQHAVADNCHLHRYTEQAIDAVFGLQPASNSSTLLQHERFLVDNMWPVSCQSCGVIQRIAA